MVGRGRAQNHQLGGRSFVLLSLPQELILDPTLVLVRLSLSGAGLVLEQLQEARSHPPVQQVGHKYQCLDLGRHQ